MTLYPVAVFLHVLGALGFAAELAIEWAALPRLRRARSPEQARPWWELCLRLARLSGPAAGTVLVTGIYMAVTAWGGRPWIGLGLLGLVLLGALGGGITGRRYTSIARAVESASGREDSLLHRFEDPWLDLSLRLRTALLVGIVFLMAAKPTAGTALAAMTAAVVVGSVWSAPAFRRWRSPSPALRA